MAQPPSKQNGHTPCQVHKRTRDGLSPRNKKSQVIRVKDVAVLLRTGQVPVQSQWGMDIFCVKYAIHWYSSGLLATLVVPFGLPFAPDYNAVQWAQNI
ncbi:hypothetical protein BaRGS_00001939 [Batillaria attramentaria]|uniref:Uncharacterized protein n=1 Tax=Batillaria attramentaria TaxID=370345 RepID=A0ABD0M6H4_9CAEN